MPNSHDPVVSGTRAGTPGDLALRLSATLEVDRPLAPYDIRASKVHIGELARIGLIDADGHQHLATALQAVGEEIEAGRFAWDARNEDVHMNVEAAVREAVGPELAGQLRQFSSNLTVLAPASFFSALVPLIIFAAFQRYFVQGLLAGSVK